MMRLCHNSCKQFTVEMSVTFMYCFLKLSSSDSRQCLSWILRDVQWILFLSMNLSWGIDQSEVQSREDAKGLFLRKLICLDNCSWEKVSASISAHDIDFAASISVSAERVADRTTDALHWLPVFLYFDRRHVPFWRCQSILCEKSGAQLLYKQIWLKVEVIFWESKVIKIHWMLRRLFCRVEATKLCGWGKDVIRRLYKLME